METVLVINGEAYWQDYLPDFNVISKKIQNTQWLWKESELIAIDTNGVCVPNKILWRVGAIKPAASHRVALEMIALSQIACVNSAEVLLTGPICQNLYASNAHSLRSASNSLSGSNGIHYAQRHTDIISVRGQSGELSRRVRKGSRRRGKKMAGHPGFALYI